MMIASLKPALLPTQLLLLRLGALLGVLAASGGCQPARSTHPQPPQDVWRSPAREQAAAPLEARAKPRPAPAADRQKQVQEVAQALEQLRGLSQLRPLQVQWVDRAAVRRFVHQELTRTLSAEQEAAYVATLASLGLLPAGYQLRQALEELASEQVAGLYDPRSERLLIQKDMPAGEVVLAHEITHALQDQHYDLDRLEQATKDNDDQEFARHALVEGDATLTMVAYMRQTLTVWKALRLAFDLVKIAALDEAKLQAAPLYVRETLLRTYLDGLQFVQALRAQGGWQAVNAAYARFPASSEQILHPEKYLRQEAPLAVSVPPLPVLLDAGWSPLHANTLGELGVLLFLRSGGVSEPQARLGAAGWGGDRLQSYRQGERVLTIWRLVWDDRAEARQFQRLLSQLLTRRYGSRPRGKPLWGGPAGLAAVAAGKAEVALLVGLDAPAQAQQIARSLGLRLQGPSRTTER